MEKGELIFYKLKTNMEIDMFYQNITTNYKPFEYPKTVITFLNTETEVIRLKYSVANGST